MLQTIHDRAHGWIAWMIVALISIPFVFWGIHTYLGIGSEPVVASVNGIEIKARDLDRRMQTARMQLHERLGAAYDTAGIDERQLRQQVLDAMIQETLVGDVSRRLGLGVSDQELRAEILAIPAFQSDGRFDKALYSRALEMRGMSEDTFAASLRQDIVGTQIRRAVTDSELATQSERDDLERLLGQKREVSWARIPASKFKDDAPIPDAEIQSYYDSNSAQFEVPEQVKLDYVVLDAAALAAKTQPSDADLKGVYDSQKDRFGQPERRKVRHILISVPSGVDDAKVAEAKAKIEAIRGRIQGGEPFEKVAKEVSQDPGSAAQGGELGEIDRGMMDPGFEQAAFSQPVGEVGEPVRSRFGWHLIEVESISPAHVKPFEEVRAQIAADLAKQKAETLYYDMGERLANRVFEHSDSLEPAAQELGLAIQHSGWISRQGGQGLLGSPKVTAAAFSEEVLNEHRNSDAIEPEKDALKTIVLRVTDHREASTKPLAEVRNQVVEALRLEKAQKAAADAAQADAERLRGGASWSEVLPDTKVEEPGLVGRQDPKLPPEVRNIAFTLPVPPAGQDSAGPAAFDNGDAAVVRVSKVEQGDLKSKDRDAAAKALTRSLGRASYEAVVKDMEGRAKIERKAPSTGPEG